MSGKPNREGVEQLSACFRQLSDAQDEIKRIESIISTKQTELDENKEKANTARKSIQQLMQEMDVAAPGNFGYEGRLMWLLQALNSQAERYGRQTP